MYEENETMAIDTAELESAWQDDEDIGAVDGQSGEQEDQPAADQREQEEPSKQDDVTSSERLEAEQGQADQPELFTLKNRDETRQVTRDELVAMAQKGWDYDTVRQERDELRTYRQEFDPAVSLVKNYAERNGMTVPQYLDFCRKQELMSQGINEQTAAAQVQLEKQQAALQSQNSETEAAQRRAESLIQQAKTRAESRKQDMLAFLKRYPGVKGDSIPKEVWARVQAGESLVTAYTMHKNQELEARLKAEQKNRENAVLSTGSMDSKISGVSQKEVDHWWYDDD